MPRIIDYERVKQRMSERGFVSLYHNSGAFGFAADAPVETVGWIETDDPSIRDTARALARQVDSIGSHLPLAVSQITGSVWLLPKSHWHYELHFGNTQLLEPLLRDVGIDPDALRERNDGSAIEFDVSERELLIEVVKRLLINLRGSDFLLAFPDAMTLATIHHHNQIWWQTLDPSIHPILVR